MHCTGIPLDCTIYYLISQCHVVWHRLEGADLQEQIARKKEEEESWRKSTRRFQVHE